MNFLVNCVKGIAIGAGAILPGISSGVLCVIFGIYEKLLDSILNFFKDLKNNSKFLTPLIIGAGIGILLFSNILNYLLFKFPIQTKSVFIGLILGSIPSLIKEIPEIIVPNKIEPVEFKIEQLYDAETDEKIQEISPGVKGQKVKIKLPIKCEKDWIIRRKK